MNELFLLAPLVTIGSGALLLLVIDALVPGRVLATVAALPGASIFRGWQALFTTIVLAAALFFAALRIQTLAGGDLSETHSIFAPLFDLNNFALVMIPLVLGAALLSHWSSAGALTSLGIERQTEYYFLYLMVVLGGLVMVSSGELITLFVGWEILYLSLYAMAGSRVGDRRSAEAALKYFILGSFSSAIILYGIALTYGATGSTSLNAIALSLSDNPSALTPFALGALTVGALFKIGCVPFHYWCPDVYSGSPTPVTVFMASVVKVAAVGLALKILWVAFPSELWLWSGMIWFSSVGTMVLANLVALRQRHIKRMLAYSSIAHVGYILAAFLSHGGTTGSRLAAYHGDGGAAIIYYLVAYSMMIIGAFAVVQLVAQKYGNDLESDSLDRYRGLAQTNPMLAAMLAIFMFGLAGLPPGVAGLVGKIYLFSAAIRADYVGLAVIGMLASAAGCYYYLRVVVLMYFQGPVTVAYTATGKGALNPTYDNSTEVSTPALPQSSVVVASVNKIAVPSNLVMTAGDPPETPAFFPPQPTSILVLLTIALCALSTVLLGILPSPLYSFAMRMMAGV